MTADSRQTYPGEMLGLPERGPGSLASLGRRFGALLIDWLIAGGLALLAYRLAAMPFPWVNTAQLVVWLVLGAAAVPLFGFTPGQLVFRLAVIPVEGINDRVGVGRSLIRVLLVGLVVPPLFTDWDGRGLHDRVTATAVVRR